MFVNVILLIKILETHKYAINVVFTVMNVMVQQLINVHLVEVQMRDI